MKTEEEKEIAKNEGFKASKEIIKIQREKFAVNPRKSFQAGDSKVLKVARKKVILNFEDELLEDLKVDGLAGVDEENIKAKNKKTLSQMRIKLKCRN